MQSVSHLRAIVYAISGFTAWVLCDTCAKVAAGMGVPPLFIGGMCGIAGIATLALLSWSRGEIKKLWPRHPRRQLARALVATGSTFVNIIAVKHLPLTIFYLIIFMAPIVIALLAAVFLKERLSVSKMLAIVAGFVGVVIAINPAGHIEGDWIGYVAVISGVFFYAANIIWLRTMTQNQSTESLIFFGGAVMAIIGLGASLLTPPESLPLKAILCMLGMGFLNTFGNLLNYTALKHTGATTVSQFHYTQIITGSLMGYLLWHEVPTWHFLTGAAIIIVSGCYIAAQAHKTRVSAIVSEKFPV